MRKLAAPASAAPSGQTARQTIQQIESEGYKVIQTTVGSGSIDNCTVSAVRPGRSITDLTAAPRGNTVEVVRYTTVYVDLACGRPRGSAAPGRLGWPGAQQSGDWPG